jgi:hypothetical protein
MTSLEDLPANFTQGTTDRLIEHHFNFVIRIFLKLLEFYTGVSLNHWFLINTGSFYSSCVYLSDVPMFIVDRRCIAAPPPPSRSLYASTIIFITALTCLFLFNLWLLYFALLVSFPYLHDQA